VGNGYQVETLFTDEDGYTVHRFVDDHYYRYYVTGPGPAVTHTQHPTGKTTFPDSVSTSQPVCRCK
jgi:hypothetical protein